MRFDVQRQNTIRKPSKKGILTHEAGIQGKVAVQKNERKMAVCFPLPIWQTVSNEESKGEEMKLVDANDKPSIRKNIGHVTSAECEAGG